MSGQEWGAEHDPEDKAWWVQRALLDEQEFVDVLAPRLGLCAQVNPDKEYDETALDLIVDGVLADLKCQRKPFFNATKYGFEPRWTVTFNLKDAIRYQEYRTVRVFFWVRWEMLSLQLGERLASVPPLRGVWEMRLPDAHALIDQAPVHYYQRRGPDEWYGMDEKRNAAASYLLDLRDMACHGWEAR